MFSKNARKFCNFCPSYSNEDAQAYIKALELRTTTGKVPEFVTITDFGNSHVNKSSAIDTSSSVLSRSLMDLEVGEIANVTHRKTHSTHGEDIKQHTGVDTLDANLNVGEDTGEITGETVVEKKELIEILVPVIGCEGGGVQSFSSLSDLNFSETDGYTVPFASPSDTGERFSTS